MDKACLTWDKGKLRGVEPDLRRDRSYGPMSVRVCQKQMMNRRAERIGVTLPKAWAKP